MKFFFKNSNKFINLSILTIAVSSSLGLSQQLSYSKHCDALFPDSHTITENLINGFDKQNELMQIAAYKVGKPYIKKGRKYRPQSNFSYKAEGLASWYGKGFHGKKTANGEIFNMHGISAAHKTLQLPCIALVTNLENGKMLIVRINDRGPFHKDNRIIDLSKAAAEKLGFKKQGIAKVRVEVMQEKSIKLAANCQKKEIHTFKRELDLYQKKKRTTSKQV